MAEKSGLLLKDRSIMRIYQRIGKKTVNFKI